MPQTTPEIREVQINLGGIPLKQLLQIIREVEKEKTNVRKTTREKDLHSRSSGSTT